MNVHVIEEQLYNVWTKVLRQEVNKQRLAEFPVLNRDECLAKLYGHKPGYDAIATARRQRDITAGMTIAPHPEPKKAVAPRPTLRTTYADRVERPRRAGV